MSFNETLPPSKNTDNKEQFEPEVAPETLSSLMHPEIEKAVLQADKERVSGHFILVSLDNLAMIMRIHGGRYTRTLIDGMCRDIKHYFSNHFDCDASVIKQQQDLLEIILIGCSDKEIENITLGIYHFIQNYGCENSSQPIQLMATMGSVCFPDSGIHPEDIYNKAYIALSDARECFVRHTSYGAESEKKHSIQARNQMVLANFLQHAFLNKKLRFAYQPIISTEQGTAAYYECLLRIVNEDGSLCSAGPFIPIAEKMGFIDVIDALVLKMAIRELISYPKISLSINVSNKTIYNSQWLLLATRLLNDKSISERLIIEITESAEIKDPECVRLFIEKVHQLGCRVAIDDFGVGHTSFLQLKNLPIDILKIDGSFIRTVIESPQSRFIVKTLVDYCKTFNLHSVAEFVESVDLSNVLSEMGVDYLQGNYFHPAVNYRIWLQENQDNKPEDER